MLHFILNILYFSIGFFIPLSLRSISYFNSNDKENLFLSFLILISGLFLFLYGPNIVAFGLFLGSGWKLLNFTLDYFL
ncbi:MAG: hypothetical protein CMA42_01940 [Euryarchaeota archaeon]|nr:hypothetical protein [Euryarchaeota archaeon]OUV66798.1 MAG: hypothetical protein CBC89_04130 [Euryarchaeota archaeon TMED129]